MVAVIAIVVYGQRKVRIRPTVEKESKAGNGQGWTLSGLLVVANDVQLDEGD